MVFIFGDRKQGKKTGKTTIIEWDEEGEMKALIDKILLIPPRRIGETYLFTTRQGKPYFDPETMRCNAFDSAWQRFMDWVMKLTKVKDRFHEHDLRAKVASDSDTLQEASDRLSHSSTEITKRVYRRKSTIVQPLIKKNMHDFTKEK